MQTWADARLTAARSPIIREAQGDEPMELAVAASRMAIVLTPLPKLPPEPPDPPGMWSALDDWAKTRRACVILLVKSLPWLLWSIATIIGMVIIAVR
jgi:hypothetical protein